MSDDFSAPVADVAVDTVITTATVPVTDDSTTRDIAVAVVETTETVETVAAASAPNPFFAFLISLAFCKCAAPSQTAVKVTETVTEVSEVASAAAETTTATTTIVAAEATASYEEFVEVTTTTVTTTETIVEEVDASEQPASPISEVANSTVSEDTAVKRSEDGANTGSEAGSTSGAKDKKARRRMSQTIKDFGGKLRTLGRSKTSSSLEETKEVKEA